MVLIGINDLDFYISFIVAVKTVCIISPLLPFYWTHFLIKTLFIDTFRSISILIGIHPQRCAVSF